MRLNLNDALGIDEGVVTNESLREVIGSVSADVIDLTDSEAELEAAGELLQDLFTNEGRLGEYVDVMNSSLESAENGLEYTAARALDLAIDSVNENLGLEAYGLASLESFNSPATRADATTDAIVAIEGTMAKIGQGIKNMMAKIWRKIKQFILKFLAGSKTLRKAIVMLKSKVIDRMNSGAIEIKAGDKIWNDKNHVNRIFESSTKNCFATTFKLFDESVAFIRTIGGGADLGAKAPTGTYVCLAGKTVTLSADGTNPIKIEKRKDATVTSISGNKGLVLDLYAGLKTIPGKIESLKGLTSVIDQASNRMDRASSAIAGIKGPAGGIGAKAVNADRKPLMKRLMFHGITMLGILNKGGWDTIRFIYKAGKASGTDKSNATPQDELDNGRSAATDSFQEAGSFDEFWDTI